jgi:hypothetical protein
VLNLIKSNNDGRLAELEANVTDASAKVTETRQAHRLARLAFADASEAAETNLHSEALAAAREKARAEMAVASDAVGPALRALAEAERRLTALKEAPERTAGANRLRSHAASADKLDKQVAVFVQLRDWMRQTPFPAADAMTAGGPAEFRAVLNATEIVANYVKSGGIARTADHLRAYAQSLEAGHVNKSLDPTFAELFAGRLPD